MKPYYTCDPVKHTECTKENCFLAGGTCSMTHEKKFALGTGQELFADNKKEPEETK